VFAEIYPPSLPQNVIVHWQGIEEKEVAHIGIRPSIDDRALRDEYRLDSFCSTLKRKALDGVGNLGRSDENRGLIEYESERGLYSHHSDAGS
jgi:hypothetical protein